MLESVAEDGKYSHTYLYFQLSASIKSRSSPSSAGHVLSLHFSEAKTCFSFSSSQQTNHVTKLLVSVVDTSEGGEAATGEEQSEEHIFVYPNSPSQPQSFLFFCILGY